MNAYHPAPVALLAALTLAVATTPAAGAEPCKAEGRDLTESLGIDPAKISETRHETVFGGASFMTLTGYRVWLASQICDGSFVIELDRQCRMTGSFSSGSCDRDALAKEASGKNTPGK